MLLQPDRKLSHKRRKLEPQHFYVSLDQFGVYGQKTLAKINFTRAVPIVYEPDDYKLFISRFTLTSSEVPVFFQPPAEYQDLFQVAIIGVDWGRIDPSASTPFPYYLNNNLQVKQVFNEPLGLYQPVSRNVAWKRLGYQPIFSYNELLAYLNQGIRNSAKELINTSATAYTIIGGKGLRLPVFDPSIENAKHPLSVPWLSASAAAVRINYTDQYVPDLFLWEDLETVPPPLPRKVSIHLCVTKAIADKLGFSFKYLADLTTSTVEITGCDNLFSSLLQDKCLVFVDIGAMHMASSNSTITTNDHFFYNDGTQREATWPTCTYNDAIENVSSLPSWNAAHRLLFRTNLPLFQSEIGGQLAITDTIVTEFDINSAVGHPLTNVSVVISNNEYYSISSGTPLSDIYIQVFWMDAYGLLHPLEISGGDRFSMKIGFQKI